jgi:hypothetical protein
VRPAAVDPVTIPVNGNPTVLNFKFLLSKSMRSWLPTAAYRRELAEDLLEMVTAGLVTN